MLLAGSIEVEDNEGRMNMVIKKYFLILNLCFIGLLCVTGPSSDAQEIAEIIEGAKREGKLLYYSDLTLPDCTLMAKEFEKKYPFVKVEVLRSSGESLLTRALGEARAKSLKAGIFQASIVPVSIMKQAGFLMNYVSPESKAWPAKFKDTEDFWNAFQIFPYVITYNTKLISRQEAPKTYFDLLAPKWKGKIGLETEDTQWFFHLIKVMGREKGIDYMKQLAKQDLMFHTGHPLQIQLCISGELPIVVVGYYNHVEQEKSKGAPIEWVRFESFPTIASVNAVSIVANSPTPNAAKLFYNFLISREAAKILRETLRRVPGNPDEQPHEIRTLNIHTAFPEEFLANYKQVMKEWQEIFRPPKSK